MSRSLLVRRLCTFLLLLAANSLLLWQLRHPTLRFAGPLANDVIGFALGLGLPWLAVVTIFRIGSRWSTALGLVFVLPLLLYSAGFLIGSTISVEALAQISWNKSAVHFYRINGGATTDFAVEVRHQRNVFPGVELVRTLDTIYPCAAVQAKATERGIIITDEHSECSGLVPPHREYLLRRFVYF